MQAIRSQESQWSQAVLRTPNQCTASTTAEYRSHIKKALQTSNATILQTKEPHLKLAPPHLTSTPSPTSHQQFLKQPGVYILSLHHDSTMQHCETAMDGIATVKWNHSESAIITSRRDAHAVRR